MNTVTEHINRMIDFGVAHGLLAVVDRAYARNLLMDAVGLGAPGPCAEAREDAAPLPPTLTPMLEALCDHAVANAIIEHAPEARERFSARLAGLITPPPSMLRLAFYGLCEAQGSKEATDWFYHVCRACDYIKVDQIAKNRLYLEPSPYGELEITINLSKPEKDPMDIIAQKDASQLDYPKCMLCVENPGYAGRPGYPARQNHRTIPIELGGHSWHLQYSPYVYYDEHCIVLNENHIPMHVDLGNLSNMFDFVNQFPHYFIGSNADLPIVGGSILNHDHFQGGMHLFPMDKARPLAILSAPEEGVQAEVVHWPMSCIRLKSEDSGALKRLAGRMLDAWRGYSDESLDILAHTDQPHNTITPVLRREDDAYVLSLVLRNNRATDKHPLGLFHPHADLHHVKKENIGLIEVMGLFILPGRLLTELSELSKYLTGEADIAAVPPADSPMIAHYPWAKQLAQRLGTRLTKEQADREIRAALAQKCTRVLEDAGVFKLDELGQAGLLKFLGTLGYKQIYKRIG